ncbi:hypothetical protein BV22DRAFT_1200351 [Leucogyrophana mollusca]|uniref:Uncharacterized protein n=1 Tax=Leucogyrophana mollusca TaxID=85980 RepID=A0ACB8AUE6_9AGAM|nr:hypothetical protein BV22DRAFT_1200351 [Leucogyrophana mollusca]
MQRAQASPALCSYTPYLDDFRGQLGDAGQSLQFKLDIARLSKNIHQTQASLSKLKVLYTLIIARRLLHEADSASEQALSATHEIGRIRQSMVDTGVAVQSTRPNEQPVLDALASIDAKELLLQGVPLAPA